MYVTCSEPSFLDNNWPAYCLIKQYADQFYVYMLCDYMNIVMWRM